MKTPVRSGNVVCFGAFELDLRARELRKDRLSTGLPEQSIRILALLVEKPGEVVLREEIRKMLWPNDTVVEFDHSINAAMKRLRQALGESADAPHYIETLARRGYRWMTPVRWGEATLGRPDAAAPPGNESFASNLIGKKVSHYRVLEILGGGGMGVVYRAEDLKLGRRVAVKFLPEEFASDPAALNRFEREARAASALSHPSICTIYEIEEHEEQPFIVMELLEGQTLRELISASGSQNAPLQLDMLLDLAIQIADGLGAAHQKGIIHRDIKPANVFVTTQSQVKILDFGLAKLARVATAVGYETELAPHNGNHTEGIPDETVPLTTPDPFLSRTGMTIGTAGYMSPEQARGEKLDARTDLFSFGSVLYEMATGKRAFTGDTGPVLQEAILNQVPCPVRKLNPELPAKLEKIISKALEKDREVRYQSAAEMCAELESIREAKHRNRSRWGELAAGGVVLLLILNTILWFNKHKPLPPEAQLDLKLRQLTVKSFENRVLSGAISPDGKYLAYADAKGIHIQLVESGETRVVPQPEELINKEMDWEVVNTGWYPDSARFVANARLSTGDGSSRASSTWMVSVLGGTPRKLRDNAVAYSVSRDGSVISFGTNKGRLGDREIWLMGPAGEQARKLFDTDENSSIGGTIWAPDGQRIIYFRTDESGDSLVIRNLKGGPLTTIFPPSERKRVNDAYWLADGRLIYSVAERESFLGSACNFWELRLAEGSARKSIDKPRRLTNWSDSCMSNISVTADGKRLAFLKWAGHSISYVGDLAAGGTHVLQPRHFPLSESSDGAAAWTADSKAIILVSNRTGHFGIYKQFLDEDTAEPLVTEGFGRNPRVTPGGQNIIYLGLGRSGGWPAREPEPVMRVPITGGLSELLFIARPFSLLSCAKSPSTLCVIAEPTEDRKLLNVTALDSSRGRGRELAHFPLDPNDDGWFSDLSPDGTRIAATQSPAGPIYILSLSGQPLQQIHVKGWGNILGFTWAPDGKGLFVTAGTRGGHVVLGVDLRGNAHALWESAGASGETTATPSPDGRHIAIQTWRTNGNMWMMENF